MRVTVSLPDDVARKLFEEKRRTGLKISQIVKKSLEEHMEIPDVEVKVTPTVLWKLRGRRYPRGPSITALGRRKIGKWQVYEMDKVRI